MPVIYLEVKGDFANLPSFPAFQIGSITHNENSKTPGVFQLFKGLILSFSRSQRQYLIMPDG